MPKQKHDSPHTHKRNQNLHGRIAHLRRRQTTLINLIDSLRAYARYAGQECDLTSPATLREIGQTPIGCLRRGPQPKEMLTDGMGL